MIWNYIRTRVRESILAGVNDAIADLEQDNQADTPEVARLAIERLRPALPSPETEPATNKRKATAKS